MKKILFTRKLIKSSEEYALKTFQVKLNKKDKVLVVEDVITTGKSSKECANCVESYGGEVVAEAAIIDRSINPINFGFPVISLATIDAPLYDSDNLPAELAKIEVIRPGSRKI